MTWTLRIRKEGQKFGADPTQLQLQDQMEKESSCHLVSHSTPVTLQRHLPEASQSVKMVTVCAVDLVSFLTTGFAMFFEDGG